LQERLGHSQIGITLATYSHVMPSLQHEAAEKLDAVLEGKAAT
jgi:integrase